MKQPDEPRIEDLECSSERSRSAEYGSVAREWRRFRRHLDPKIRRLEHRIDRLLDHLESSDEPNPESQGLSALRTLRRRVHSLAAELDERPESSTHWQILHASVLQQWEAISRSARMVTEDIRQLTGRTTSLDGIADQERDSQDYLAPRFGPKR